MGIKKRSRYRERYKYSPNSWLVQERVYERCRQNLGLERTKPLNLETQKKFSLEHNKKKYISEIEFMKLWSSKTKDRLHRNRPMLNRFFADFVDFKRKVIFEIDGRSHEGKEEYDKVRDSLLEASGFIVIRLKMNQRNTWPSTLAPILKIKTSCNFRTNYGNGRRQINKKQTITKKYNMVYDNKIPIGFKLFSASNRIKPLSKKPDLDKIMELSMAKTRDMFTIK